MLGECSGIVYSSSVSSTRGLKNLGSPEGDWVKVQCLKTTCFNLQQKSIYADYNNPDDDHDDTFDKKVLELRKKHRKPCVEGWTRWRLDDGRILLAPEFTPDSC